MVYNRSRFRFSSLQKNLEIKISCADSSGTELGDCHWIGLVKNRVLWGNVITLTTRKCVRQEGHQKPYHGSMRPFSCQGFTTLTSHQTHIFGNLRYGNPVNINLSGRHERKISVLRHSHYQWRQDPVFGSTPFHSASSHSAATPRLWRARNMRVERRQKEAW